MNSGLQCVLATPSILDFFLNFSPEASFRDLEMKNNTGQQRLSRLVSLSRIGDLLPFRAMILPVF
jgi:hypothetical protein